LARTIRAFHAPGGLRYRLLLGIDAIVEVPGPVVSEVLGLDPLELDLVLFPVLLSGLGVNHLGGVELRRSRQDGRLYLRGELADGESPAGTGYKSGCHRALKCKYKEKFNQPGNFQSFSHKPNIFHHRLTKGLSKNFILFL